MHPGIGAGWVILNPEHARWLVKPWHQGVSLAGLAASHVAVVVHAGEQTV
jgi:hypothetical protein